MNALSIVNPDIREIREQQNVTFIGPEGEKTVRVDALLIWWSEVREVQETKYRKDVLSSGIKERLAELARYSGGYASRFSLVTEEHFSLTQYENAEVIIESAAALTRRRCDLMVRELSGRNGSVRLGSLDRREDLDHVGYRTAVAMIGTGALALANRNDAIGFGTEIVLKADFNLRLHRFFGKL